MCSISVIVCTYQRIDVLPDLLRDVMEQLPPTGELWVVDQSEAGIADAVRALVSDLDDHRARLLTREPGLPAARNHGLEHATGEVVWFLDDDCRLHPNALLAHLQRYREAGVGGVVGRIDERHVRANASRTMNRVDLGGRVRTNLEGEQSAPVETLKGCNMSFLRRALIEAGGFDEHYAGTAFLEDADASTRVRAMGWTLWFEPQARVQHLSAPAGGVRQGSDRKTEWWRFHNTGYFMARHRGRRSLALFGLTFSAIAARRAIGWRSPMIWPSLMGALVRGWSRGRQGSSRG